jgi:hypothetical protein
MERDLGAPDLRIHWVRVTNHGKTPFTDQFDGIPVAIPPGKSENLQLDMAAHFFGYSYEVANDLMFRHTAKRQGWNTPKHVIPGEDGKTLAETLWANIEINPVIYKMVEEKVDTSEPIPADPQPPQIQKPKQLTAKAPVIIDLDDEEPELPRTRKAGAS